jgi:hypothetical protein
LQEDEIAIFFKNKLYFKCKQKRLKVFAKDNKEYLIILNNNKIKNEG